MLSRLKAWELIALVRMTFSRPFGSEGGKRPQGARGTRESRADGEPVCSVIMQRNNKNDSNYGETLRFIRSGASETLTFGRRNLNRP